MVTYWYWSNVLSGTQFYRSVCQRCTVVRELVLPVVAVLEYCRNLSETRNGRYQRYFEIQYKYLESISIIQHPTSLIMTTPPWALVASSSNHDGDNVVTDMMDNENDMVPMGLGFASPSQNQQQQLHHIRDYVGQDLRQGMQPNHLTTGHGHDNDKNNNDDTRSPYQPESIQGPIKEESTFHADAAAATTNCNNHHAIIDTNAANGDNCVVDDDDDEATLATRLAAQEAMIRAQVIIQKFGIRHSTTTSSADTTPSAMFGGICSFSSTTIDDHDCKRRRDICLEQERVRLEKALLQNWEYLAKREEERLQHQLRLIDAAKQLEQDQVQRRVLQTKVLEQQQQQKQSRNGHLPSSQAGIGTLEQRNRKRKVNQQQQRQQQEQDCSSSLYLSNLSSATSMDVIRNLFQSYGTIKRVHFYSNKTTGLLKGDGLVTYETNKKKQITTDFLQSICQQVSFCLNPHVCPS